MMDEKFYIPKITFNIVEHQNDHKPKKIILNENISTTNMVENRVDLIREMCKNVCLKCFFFVKYHWNNYTSNTGIMHKGQPKMKLSAFRIRLKRF